MNRTIGKGGSGIAVGGILFMPEKGEKETNIPYLPLTLWPIRKPLQRLEITQKYMALRARRKMI